MRNDEGRDDVTARRTGDDTDVLASRNGEQEITGTAADSEVGAGGNDNDEESKRQYFPLKYKRSLFMCESEQKLAVQLTELFESNDIGRGSLMFGDPEGVVCEGVIKGRCGEEHCCDAVTVRSCRGILREVTIYTLNHDYVTIVVRDWICDKCGQLKVYRGTSHGI